MGDNKEVMASSTALRAAKKELRGLMKQKLSSLSSDEISTQSFTVFKRLTSFTPYQAASRIGVYLSMPTGEVQTDAIVRHALGAGKQVFVPYLFKPSAPPPQSPKMVMDMVRLRDVSDYESLRRDSWGIPTIGSDTVEDRENVLSALSLGGSEALDMILMPGVAFDMDPESSFVRRLGHGKGFYDYFLHRYRELYGAPNKQGKSPQINGLLFGLALEEQVLVSEGASSIPVGEHDHLLHGLFVGDGQLIQGNTRSR